MADKWIKVKAEDKIGNLENKLADILEYANEAVNEAFTEGGLEEMCNELAEKMGIDKDKFFDAVSGNTNVTIDMVGLRDDLNKGNENG